jgi:hypothetical protein
MSRDKFRCPGCRALLAEGHPRGFLVVDHTKARIEKSNSHVAILSCRECDGEIEFPGMRPILAPLLRHESRIAADRQQRESPGSKVS